MLTKEEQFRTYNESKKKKKKPSMKNKPKITSSEQGYLTWLQDQFFTCTVPSCPAHDVEFHHVKEKSTDAKNHKRVIPLCREHHTGSLVLSAHGTPTKWREKMPSEYQNFVADFIYNKYLEEIGE